MAYADFKEGVAYYSIGNYDAAVISLSNAADSQPAIADYAYFFTGKAHLQAGRHAESLSALRELLSRHPGSPLIREAREMEIQDMLALSEADGALPLIEAYAASYPGDASMKYLLAKSLKGRDPARSKALFKELYIGWGMAHDELSPSDLSAQDLLERGNNLIKAFRYVEAEKCLREALRKDDGGLKARIRERIALSLFRQKRYKESGPLYVELNDLAYAARSYLRADMLEEFEATLGRLVKAGTPDAGPLMVAHGIQKRRDGNQQDALRILKSAGERFPHVAEDAAWNSGWLYYTNGDFAKAHEAFSALYDKYGSNRYLYWKARAFEKSGGDPASIYAEAAKTEDLYGILARAKAPAGAVSVSVKVPVIPVAAHNSERVELLASAGLPERAASELLRIAQTADPADIAGIALRLKDLARYREAINLTLKLPEDMRPEEVLYPLAFWPITKEISEQSGMDPYLVLSVIRAESMFDARALSPAGAVGLMQLMPETALRTASGMNNASIDPDELESPETNIALGTHYLKGLISEMGSVTAALAAYNAGEHNARKWLLRCACDPYDEFVEDIPFRETKGYVKRILATYYKYRKSTGDVQPTARLSDSNNP